MAKKSGSKKTATSKKGRSYKRSSKSKTGWVEVRSYQRTHPTRKGGARDKAANFCSRTRKKKQMGPRRKK